ncbi:MAG: molybdopterin-guanine dinucleotide biosynthesis protein B [Rhodobacteraceae bacterium]|nr:MAG: molybdopterin-guanine dinucleotide biosynthesis protein B [Paracoccaceae bacterium]|tara:strand:+ start:2108 stop:2605 length:498 start_codon:yes stop_codon:yes gene_type:complete
MKVFGIVGWKNSGKTGLMERLVREISSRGFSVSTIKHAHHTFDIDQEGKDSFRHRMAGAQEVLLSSQNKWALIHELRNKCEPDLKSLLQKLSLVDLVLVEGYKYESYPKLEAYRTENKRVPFALTGNEIIAMASDTTHPDVNLPIFDLNKTSEIATFILAKVELL